ncbi:MAG: 3-hydroxyacyl-CoA dehydrogenase family protein [Solirubrobacterales bacterium]
MRTVGISGSGNIACGLAVALAPSFEVRVLARSAASAERSRGTLARMAKAPLPSVTVSNDPASLAGADVLVEAVAEDLGVKIETLRALAALGPTVPLVTTTSSLPLAELAAGCGAPERVAAVHVFSPVYVVPLVELAYPDEATAATREAVANLCATIGKTVIEVPPVPGFVVNRVVFPMLIAAVETLTLTGLPAASVDDAMQLALGHRLGPLRTLDFIGLDVAIAIAARLDLPVPPLLRDMVAAGRLGRKSGTGFFVYRSP